MDGKLNIDTELETKSFDAQLKELESKLQIMQRTLLTENEIPIEYRMNESERIALESSIERTKNQIVNLKQKISDVGDESEETGKKMSINFEKGVKSIKRFGLSLFSIRSIYALVSKASSAYLSQNTELAQKLQNVWVGLGSFLSPVIEYLSDLLLKGLGYLNVFVKALTGTDFIANANAKALDKQAKAQENLNKQTASFDEISKVNDTSSSNNSSNVNLIETPELDDKMVKKLEELADWLIENRELVKDVGLALGITFGVAKISSLLSNISKLIGTSGTGLIGIKVGLLAIAAILATKWAVDNWIELKQGIDATKESLDGTIDRQKSLTQSAQKLSDKFWNVVESGEANDAVFKNYKRTLNETNDNFKNYIKTMEDGKNWLGKITGTNQQLIETQAEVSRKLSIATDDFIKLKNEGKVTDEELQKFSETLKENIKYLDECGVNALDLKEDYELLTGKKYEASVTANLKDNVTVTFNELIKKIEGTTVHVGVSDSYHGGGGRAFAKGDIVYQPTRALIGEAGYPEAIVPMTPDYLSVLASEISRYGNSGGSSVTNIYLDGKLIQRQISKKQEIYDFSTNS